MRTGGLAVTGCYGMAVNVGGSVTILANFADADQSDWPGIAQGPPGWRTGETVLCRRPVAR